MNNEQMSPEQISRERSYRKRLKKVKKMKMKFLFMSLLGQDRKMNWLVKNHIFGMIGEKVLYQPNTLPNEPELIKIHNNVRIAANVTFYTHDVINMMFATLDGESYIPHREWVIGDFETLHQKRRAELGTTDDIPSDDELWKRFYSKRNI